MRLINPKGGPALDIPEAVMNEVFAGNPNYKYDSQQVNTLNLRVKLLTELVGRLILMLQYNEKLKERDILNILAYNYDIYYGDD